jgi:hypothetical protein
MRVSVVVPDSTIVVDGAPLRFDFPVEDNTIEAIQWDSVALSGSIQRHGSSESFKDPAIIAPYIEAWREEVNRRATASVDHESASLAAHQDYLKAEAEKKAEREAAAKAQAEAAKPQE